MLKLLKFKERKAAGASFLVIFALLLMHVPHAGTHASTEKQLYNTKIQQSVPDCHVAIEETDELCRTSQTQNAQDSCQISISMACKHHVYQYIPADQLSILLTPTPSLHVT